MSRDGFGMLLGTFGETFWGPTPIFSVTCLKGLRKFLDFRKLARRAGERLVLEVRGDILGALGDSKTI